MNINDFIETIKDLAFRISNLEKRKFIDETYIAPTLLNSWVNYGSGFSDTGYYKDSAGVVHIKGMVKNGTTTGGTAIFTLPVGYRPSQILIIPTVSNSAFGQLRINTNGNVEFHSGSNAWFSLDNIAFRV